ncbi:MAG: MarR family winged helix-turn-helix transcriptional regulator [Oscillospiraceae bacterium]|nr:MarR family winged helix-turn-helix transcriptional regulator [Oscillospiraceae bacterium]
MTDGENSASWEHILLSFPLMHQLLHATFEGEQEHFTKTQFNILIVLHYCGERTMMQVSELIGSSKEQTTRALAPLADEGLVERYISPSNRSHVHVRLTEEGETCIRALLRRCTERLHTLVAQRLSPEETAELEQCFSSVAPLLGKITRRDPLQKASVGNSAGQN